MDEHLGLFVYTGNALATELSGYSVLAVREPPELAASRTQTTFSLVVRLS